MSVMSPFLRHVDRWKNCTRCPLHKTRYQVVLSRGEVPCDVLFVGEAPGSSEDTNGIPFDGPAGALIDKIIEGAGLPGMMVGAGAITDHDISDGEPLTWCFTNLCACIPIDPEDGQKFSEPPPESIEACAPRLEEFVKLARPRLIVCVGKLAQAWIMGTKGRRHLLKDYKGGLVGIIHPAGILRREVTAAQKQMMVQRAIVTLRAAVEEVIR